MSKLPILTLGRVIISNQATLGILRDEKGNPICKTLENPWLDNKPNVSCIPAGDYVCEVDNAGRFQYWRVLNVPGREFIEFHQGNKSRHTKGCN